MEQRQHAAVEAVYEDIAGQLDYPPDSGERWDAWSWHQIMIGLFAEAQGWPLPRFVPSESGAPIPVMRQKQSRLTKRQGADLIEFAKAYAINRGAEVREWDEDGKLVQHAQRQCIAEGRVKVDADHPRRAGEQGEQPAAGELPGRQGRQAPGADQVEEGARL
jgi:hypothetical protein